MNNGFVIYNTIEEYYLDNGQPTGLIRTNSGPNYIPPTYNTALCPLLSPTPTITISPSITPSVTVTPSVTPTICKTWVIDNESALRYDLYYNDCNGVLQYQYVGGGTSFSFCSIDNFTSAGSISFTNVYNICSLTCNTYLLINNGYGDIDVSYVDCNFTNQVVNLPINTQTYVCSTNLTPGNYGFYTVKLNSAGCNIPSSPTPTPTPTYTTTLTPTPTPSPAAGGKPAVTGFNASLFSCVTVGDYVGYYIELDRITNVDVNYTLRISFYGEAGFDHYSYVSGIIPAGNYKDISQYDPCVTGGGIVSGGDYTILDVCIETIDYTVDNPFCLCSGICPSVTPTPTKTPSVTPSISVTPSVTPSISVTPSVTPSITITPSPSTL